MIVPTEQCGLPPNNKKCAEKESPLDALFCAAFQFSTSLRKIFAAFAFSNAPTRFLRAFALETVQSAKNVVGKTVGVVSVGAIATS